MKAKMDEIDEIWAIYRRNLGQNSRWNINLPLKINFGHWIAILPLESHLGHQITLHEGGEISQKNGRFISDISPRTDISPIFWRYLRKYLPSNFSPRNIVSTPLDTRYIGDISPIYPDIFLLAFKSFTIFLVKNYFFHCFRIWMLMAFIMKFAIWPNIIEFVFL